MQKLKEFITIKPDKIDFFKVCNKRQRLALPNNTVNPTRGYNICKYLGIPM